MADDNGNHQIDPRKLDRSSKTERKAQILQANSSRVSFGRKVIKLPLEKEDINAKTIDKYIGEVLATFLMNLTDMNYLYNYYKGKQPILHKAKVIRPEINFICAENHAYEIVEFKKGYMFGHPIKYAQNEASSTDDIGILNKYMLDQNKAKGDMLLAEYMYTMGTAYRWVLPKKTSYDINSEAPFRLIEGDPRENFIVYSTNLANDVLFGGSITQAVDEKGNVEYKITIYTDKMVYIYIGNGVDSARLVSESINGIGMIPIIEYPLNESRISPIEVVMSMLDALNIITSNELDDVSQFVNSLLAFFNVDVTKELLDEILDLGAVKLNTIDPQKPADLKMIQQALNHADVQVLFDRIYGKMLGIIGVPKQSDSPRSSGDTGQARLLGEGWTLADQRAKIDEAYFEASDREVLRIAFNICKTIKGCKLNELSCNDVEIKFNRSKGDNMLVKSQSLTNLINAGVEFETSLATVDLFSDPHEVANKSKVEKEENKQEMLEEQQMFANQNNEENDNSFDKKEK